MTHVEMLSGRRKKDYAAESAASALETQAAVMGVAPSGGELPDDDLDEVEDPDEAVAAIA